MTKVEKATAAYYRRRATDSIIGAENAPTAKSQSAYLELAAMWLELAQRAILLKEEKRGWLVVRDECCQPIH